ncbi:hypothetical protein HN873_047901 [Arachis hypogaea]
MASLSVRDSEFINRQSLTAESSPVTVDTPPQPTLSLRRQSLTLTLTASPSSLCRHPVSASPRRHSQSRPHLVVTLSLGLTSPSLSESSESSHLLRPHLSVTLSFCSLWSFGWKWWS